MSFTSAPDFLLPFHLANSPSSSSLLADPKSRKVIIVEHPLLPLYIKETIARILFDNLQVFVYPESPFHDPNIFTGPFNIVRIQSPSLSARCRENHRSST